VAEQGETTMAERYVIARLSVVVIILHTVVSFDSKQLPQTPLIEDQHFHVKKYLPKSPLG